MSKQTLVILPNFTANQIQQQHGLLIENTSHQMQK